MTPKDFLYVVDLLRYETTSEEREIFLSILTLQKGTVEEEHHKAISTRLSDRNRTGKGHKGVKLGYHMMISKVTGQPYYRGHGPINPVTIHLRGMRKVPLINPLEYIKKSDVSLVKNIFARYNIPWKGIATSPHGKPIHDAPTAKKAPKKNKLYSSTVPPHGSHQDKVVTEHDIRLMYENYKHIVKRNCIPINGVALREAINRTGSNIRAFAKRSNISERMIYKWLNEKSNPKLKTLLRLAHFLKVEPRTLLPR